VAVVLAVDAAVDSDAEVEVAVVVSACLCDGESLEEACRDDEVVADSSLTRDPFGGVVGAGGEEYEKVVVAAVVEVGDGGLVIPEQP